MATHARVRVRWKRPASRNGTGNNATGAPPSVVLPDGSPPTYEEALMLEDDETVVGHSEHATPATTSSPLGLFNADRRELDHEDESYSMDDEAFEDYDDDVGESTGAPHETTELPLARDLGLQATDPQSLPSREVESSAHGNGDVAQEVTAASSPRLRVSRPLPYRQEAKTAATLHSPPRRRRGQAATEHEGGEHLMYDEQTYNIISKLRALNKQLTMRLDQQARLVEHLQDERRLHLHRIQTLEQDLHAHKQTLRVVQSSSTSTSSPARPTRTLLTADHVSEVPLSRTRDPLPRMSSPTKATSAAKSLDSPRAPTAPSPGRRPQTQSSPVRSTSAPPPSLSSPTPASSSCPHCSTVTASSSTTTAPERLFLAKIEKLEQEKRDVAARHAHQLANYSHELSRLERQVENAQKLVQAKDYELRLQKSRHLYACATNGGGTERSTQGDRHAMSGSAAHHRQTLLTDALWKELLPKTPPASTLLTLPFTSHVGLAFEQLLSHQLLSFHDHMVDATTRGWLHEIRTCGFQLLTLHHTFQRMAMTFRRLAECCHIYHLADTFTSEVKQLTQAEQAFLFVLDPAENEFWCRVPRSTSSGNNANSAGHDHNEGNNMLTVRSRVMPITGIGGVSAVAAEHTGTTAQHQALAVAALAGGPGHNGVPCGLASWVYHTKKPLLLPAGHVTRNPHYSHASDNTDRLMSVKSASTLLLPILKGGTAIGVIQVCGKLAQVAALGVSISLERCDAFTLEDQVIATMLSHYVSGILPKAAYFTEVESNKVNEETLIQLAPEIFTCLRFEELGKIVIQNAKEILDADRCSLFVADNGDRMLYNWQSDISGRGGVEVFEDIKRSGMRVPFGHGIVGMVAETREIINIPDAYEDPRFNSSWDKKTNYRTKSILTVPILSSTAKKPAGVTMIRRKSQHSVYGEPMSPSRDPPAPGSSTGPDDSGNTPQTAAATDSPPAESQILLGVVQVINKSGGAPFRAKDEFLLQTISKLIALAIENSQLFQKNQELCVSLGTLIAEADLVEATARLGAAAEDIIGVESAAVYVFEPQTRELFTFHRKRRHRIAIKEQMYRHSLLEQAIQSREMLIVNDVPGSASFNAYVDSIGGLPARNVLFAPLLIPEREDSAHITTTTDANGNATTTTHRLVGVLHLVNTRGRKVKFERHDLFLSIVSSLACSVVASILEKQAMLRQKEQTRHLLDTTLSFFKEMSPVGIINAVYNTCASILNVDKAHLFLWEPDHRHMWTAKLSPNAETVSAAVASTSVANTNAVAAATGDPSSSTASSASASATAKGGGHPMLPPPSLRSQTRRISVLTDQRLRAPTNEGLIEHILSKGSLVIVRSWVDVIEEDHETEEDRDVPPDGEDPGDGSTAPPASARPRATSYQQHSVEVSKYVLQACRSDYRLGFTKHAVVGCPVWDIYGLEVVGVLVLLFPKHRLPPTNELANLPLLSRQISGALNVCHDLTALTQRSRLLQDMLEWSPRRRPLAASLALSPRGQLVAFSQPLNLTTRGFSRAAWGQFARLTSPHDLDVRRLPFDGDGHRESFVLSGATLGEMTSEHFVSWIGKDLAPGHHQQQQGGAEHHRNGWGEVMASFDKLRTDLQSVYVRRETVHGVLLCRPSPTTKTTHATSPGRLPTKTPATMTLPRTIQLELRHLLWDFVDPTTWQFDLKRACKLFDGVDPNHTRRVTRQHLEYALTTQGRNVTLDQLEWDLLHTHFADGDTDLVDVEAMFLALRPEFKAIPRAHYELVPVLDSMAQTVISVHILLTAVAST